ncbi:xylulokinase [Bauldia sp.]|uniref:xylulokinase n=1 Tax=Bauldia sp. TaxID=2575872 RepID=UPI003BA98251
MAYLGIDVGTTAVKTIVVDDEQRLLASASQGYPILSPEPGLREQDPDGWIAAVEETLGVVRSEVGAAFDEVAAIGLSGQMHSIVALDADHRPLRNAILWNDSRGSAECAALTDMVPDVAEITGVIAMTGLTAAKVLWLRNHEPAVFARIRSILLAKDYVRLWLTGDIATDMSDAAGTQLFDEQARQWHPGLVKAVGLTPEQLPRLHEGTEATGTLSREAAERLGLPAGIPVAAGGGDGGTGAAGIGCVEPGAGFVSLGTAATYVVAQDRYAPRPETLIHNFAHCVPDRWYQMGALLNGASCLAWLMTVLGEMDIGGAVAAVEADYRGPSPVMFLPYLTGERTPHNDPGARGAFFFLDQATDRSAMVQAVLEGVAYSLRDAQDCLDMAGADVARPGFIGGGSRSRFWARIIAAVLGRPVVRYRGADLGPALGAARMAIIAATGAPVAEVCTPPEEEETVEPDPALVGAYAARQPTFRALYRATREARGQLSPEAALA